jgi:tetratricopeptide (TPR) repeat protein
MTICFLFCTTLYAQNKNYDQAWELYISGQYEEALRKIHLYIEEDSTHYRSYFLKGKVFENLYRYDHAILSYQRALRLNEKSTEAKSALAMLYLQSGQPHTAIRLYEELVTDEPEKLRWKITLANALQSAGKYANALDLLKQVTDQDTLNWLVYKNMGDCYFRLDSMDHAAGCYQKSLDRYPNNRALYGLLMKIYISMEQPEKAIDIGKEAIERDSMNVEAWKQTGVAWYRQGRTKYAMKALEKTLELGDTSTTTSRHYGMLNYFLMDYSTAEKYMSMALKTDPDNLNTMLYLGVVHGYTGNAEKGLDVFAHMDSIIAHYDTIKYKTEVQKGFLYRRLYRYDDAAKSFIEGTKTLPYIDNYYEVALSYDMGNRKKQALDWYIRYLDLADPTWKNKKDLKETEGNKFQVYAMDRIEQLRIDLFFEEGKKDKPTTQ